MPFFLRWQSVADFAVLTVAFYFVLRWARSARALRLSLVILGLQALSLLTRQYDLFITGWILQAAAILMCVVLVVVFQSEWRRAFMLLDAAVHLWPAPAAVLVPTFRAIARACFEMAKVRTGALIVLPQKDAVEELVTASLRVGAIVTPELLIALFQPTAPTHDGAVMIENDKIASANNVLPLTQRRDVPAYYGTRHRAAMGLAERTDALVLAVSEERGTVTLMRGREVLPLATPEDLTVQLQGSVVEVKPARRSLLERAGADWKLKAASIALAALIWSLSFLAVGTTVRNITVAVEFVNVPRGLDIRDVSADSLEAQLRGTPWVMDSVALTRLSARFNLAGLKAGRKTVPVGQSSINLPPGVSIERLTPSNLTFRLVDGS